MAEIFIVNTSVGFAIRICSQIRFVRFSTLTDAACNPPNSSSAVPYALETPRNAHAPRVDRGEQVQRQRGILRQQLHVVENSLQF